MQIGRLVAGAWSRLGFAVRVLLDLVSNASFRLLYRGSRRGLPPVTNRILLLSSTALAAKIRKQEITSEQLVTACIERISEVNSLINAVVDRRFEAALVEARRCDRLVVSLSEVALEKVARDQPFLGVPFSTKEGIRVAGLRHSYGVVARREVRAVEDAACVRLLRRAGAIPLCVTNVSELGMWWDSSNYVYGATSNPYSLAHIPGGSSGGEAALQTSAGIPISLASDTGGSIRTPAAFCGLFGHKPTNGTVSIAGTYIHEGDSGAQESLQCLGPLTRHAEDLAPLLEVLLGDNNHLLQLGAEVHFTRCRLFVLTTGVGGPGVSPVEPEVCLAIQRAVDYLEDTYGVTARPLHLPELTDILAMFTEELSRLDPSASLCSDMVDGRGSAWVGLEMARSLCGRGRHSAPLLAQAAMERAAQLGGWAAGLLVKAPSTAQSRPSPALIELRDRVNQLLGKDGLLLSPAHPTQPPFHYQSYLKPLNFLYTAMHNVLGLPATVVPLGLSQAGLPLALQISAAEYNDHLTLALARELERPFGGWTAPFRTDDNLGFN
jgi:fatty acid amide hydrolase 2